MVEKSFEVSNRLPPHSHRQSGYNPTQFRRNNSHRGGASSFRENTSLERLAKVSFTSSNDGSEGAVDNSQLVTTQPDSFNQFEKMLFQDTSSVFPANFHPEQSDFFPAATNFDTSSKK